MPKRRRYFLHPLPILCFFFFVSVFDETVKNTQKKENGGDGMEKKN